MSGTIVVLSTNILMAILRNFTKINLLIKLKYKITIYEDSRIQLLILYVLDASVGMKYIIKNRISDVYLLYINMLVMLFLMK